MANTSFPGLANVEAILRQIAIAIANLNTTVGDVFPPALTSSAVWNPPSVAAAGSQSTTVTVSGATLGQVSAASFSLALGGLILSSAVSSANTVTVTLSNPTAGAIDLASGTLLVKVYQ